MASSSSSLQNQLAVTAPPNPRRLPPPCWSHEDTIALIDAYCDKWYSLRRGNLRANHWQEVADAVAARFPASSPAKTSVQCRHKMEKLRKRYRTEIQRASLAPNGRRFNSSWIHFKRMDAMEKGISLSVLDLSTRGNRNASEEEESEDHNDDEDDEEEELYQSIRYGIPNNSGFHKPTNNGIGGNSGRRFKMPRNSSRVNGKPRFSPNYANPNSGPGPNPNFEDTTWVVRDRFKDKMGAGKKREPEAIGEMVAAIKGFGDGFVRMERMKMEMAREVEAMRMEMEVKRTEMILDSQQRIVEAFASAFSDEQSKKGKRTPSTES